MNPPLDGRVQSGILAVDAGGSGTRVRHTAGSSQVTTAAAPWTAGDRVATLGSCIAAAWSEMGAPETAVVSIGAAATPASTLETARLGRLVCEAVSAEEVLIANDALTAHLGALGGVAGVSLIVGTGVACLVGGADPETPPKVVEGHGYLIGDIGSAFWIGRHAVRAVLDAHQAGAPISPLGRLLEEQWGDLSGASYRIHALPDPVSAVAGLAPAVTALVERDELAATVVERAAHCLVGIVARALTLAPPGGRPLVALGGGVLGEGTWLRSRVAELVGQLVEETQLISSLGSPLDGAVALARLPYVPAGVQRWTKEPS